MIISILKPLLQMLHSKTAESVIHSPHLTVHNLLYLKEVATKYTMIFIYKLNMLHALLYTSKQQQRNSSWIELIWSFYVCMRLYHVWKISRPRQMTISILKTLLQMLHLKTAESVTHRPHMICHNLLYLKEVATKCTMIFINILSACFILCYTSKQQQRNSSWIELIWSFYVCMRLYIVQCLNNFQA